MGPLTDDGYDGRGNDADDQQWWDAGVDLNYGQPFDDRFPDPLPPTAPEIQIPLP